jgi:hypothetical protein
MTAEPSSIPLSSYDQALGVMPPFFRMLCYSYVPDLGRLTTSLARAFERFPRLATRFVEDASGASKLVRMDQPPALELRPPTDWAPEAFRVEHVPAFVGGLRPAPGQPVVAAALRPVRGGSVLSVSLSHAAGDFCSLWLFLSYWCEQFQSTVATAGEAPAPVAAAPASAPAPGEQAPAPAGRGLGKHNYSVLHYDREFLDSLREELSPEQGALSLNEVLTAFVVHRHGPTFMGRSRGLRLRVPVNVRGVHPAVPADFIGNGIVEALVPLDDLVDSPAAARRTAQRIREAVEAVRNKDFVESALQVVDGQVELRTQESPIYDREIDILATNLSRMHFHKLDFGGGPPTQFFGTHTEYNGISISTSLQGLEVRVFSEHGSISAA